MSQNANTRSITLVPSTGSYWNIRTLATKSAWAQSLLNQRLARTFPYICSRSSKGGVNCMKINKLGFKLSCINDLCSISPDVWYLHFEVGQSISHGWVLSHWVMNLFIPYLLTSSFVATKHCAFHLFEMRQKTGQLQDFWLGKRSHRFISPNNRHCRDMSVFHFSQDARQLTCMT